MHWGLEFELFPHPDQLVWARRFADVGADLVVGHHPHVIQPADVHVTTDQRHVPILYSLGNLTSMFSHPAMALSMVARVRVAVAQGRTHVVRLELVPVAFMMADSYKLVRAASVLEQDASHPYAIELARYADLVLGAEWRP